MGVSDCTKHGIIASRRCPTCHKPLCIHCDTKDGCCSEKCYQSRLKFGTKFGKAETKGPSLLVTLIKVAVVGAIAYAVARHFHWI